MLWELYVGDTNVGLGAASGWGAQEGDLDLSANSHYLTALHALELTPGGRPLAVLTVGSGSGYFSAVMAATAGPPA